LAVSEFRNNPHSTTACRVIAYKNSTIDKLNSIIRVKLFGKNASKFEPNEIIINEGGYGKHIKNGQVFRVIEASIVSGPHGIPCYLLQLSGDILEPVYVVAEEGEDLYDDIVERLERRANATKQWNEYSDFVESFATFNYSYAVNVYKVQGATIDNVYILEKEIMGVKPIGMKQKFQSMYVAVTRAKHRVYIYNKEEKVDNKGIDVLKNRFINEGN
jgi:hypothetical protein